MDDDAIARAAREHEVETSFSTTRRSELAHGGLLTFEQRLDRDPRWALSQGSLFFEGKGAVQESLTKIVRRLDGLGVPYCIAGGMALFQHGYRRFTEDVHIIVTREGLKEIHSALDGLGYLLPFARSKNLRDTETGVRIEVLVAGDYPGDDKPKPVAFPDPTSASERVRGVRFLTLPKLIELKLASGMTSPARLRDLSDVIELIRLRSLPESFADELDPYVRPKFLELWSQDRRRFIKLISDSRLDQAIGDWAGLMAAMPESTPLFEQMQSDGVVVHRQGFRVGSVCLATHDPAVAARYDMHEESEYLPEIS
jgi:hypothetical protein